MLRRNFLPVAALIGTPLAAETAKPIEAQLAERRTQIDHADEQIVHWLNRRAEIVIEVGKIKKKANLPVTAPARERQVLERIAEKGKSGPLSGEALQRIYKVIIEEMKGLEKNLPG
jgi:chorismate mutase/prephenate dehydratase